MLTSARCLVVGLGLDAAFGWVGTHMFWDLSSLLSCRALVVTVALAILFVWCAFFRYVLTFDLCRARVLRAFDFEIGSDCPTRLLKIRYKCVYFSDPARIFLYMDLLAPLGFIILPIFLARLISVLAGLIRVCGRTAVTAHCSIDAHSA